MTRAILCLGLLCAAALAEGDLVADLLGVDAPRRPWETDPLVTGFGVLKRPADDAPLDDLLDYWETEGTDPSPELQRRFVEACRAEPRLIPSVIRLLPDTAEVRPFVQAWFASPDARPFAGTWRLDAVGHWLDAEREEDPGNLFGLATASLARAFALARKLAEEEDEAQAVHGLTFLVLSATSEEERRRAVDRLRAIAADAEADPDLRNLALEAVAAEGWEDAWLLPLFADEELDLTPLAEKGPDRMISLASKVVGGEPGAVRDRAADCLLSCGERADALRPLLPWLADPEWASSIRRPWFVHQLSLVDLPECVPGLLRLIERETDEEVLETAFEALARYRVAKAAPLLRARYEAGEREGEFLHALERCGALTREEMVEGVRAYARESGEEEYSPPAMLGALLAACPPEDDGVAAALLAGGEPEIAEIVHAWPGPSSAKDLVRRIGAGTASAVSVEAALGRREEIVSAEGDELRRILRDGRGVPRGVAAALLGAPDPLDGSDRDAQRALLACARLIRLPLPAEKVARLLPDGAAEAYLLALDTPETRRCLGGRLEGTEPGEDPRARFFAQDAALREVHALASESEDGSREIVVLTYADRTVLRWSDDPARWKSRVLAKHDVEPFLDFIARNRIDDLPGIPHLADDGTTYEYLHLTPEGGCRFVIDDPDCAEGADIYWAVVRRFERLAERAVCTTRYAVADVVQGVELLATGGVEEVWAKGDDVRVVRDAWRTLEGAEAPEPPCVTDLRPSPLAEANRALNGGRILRCDRKRLWVEAEDGETVLHDGRCGFGALSADRRWFLIAIVDGDWSDPEGLVCVDLSTLAVREVDLPRAETNRPVAWLPAHRAFLVRRKGDNEKNVLLDPATGAVTEVRGTIGPLTQMGSRGLQPTGRPDEYWAATRDDAGTEVGRYDAKAFTFSVTRRFPGLRFPGHDMWVDGDRVYVAYKGDLLRLPLVP